MEMATVTSPTRQAVDSTDCHRTLGRVFENGADALYRFIVLRVGNRSDVADDLLQQACYEAARGRPPADPEACRAWLWGIARNLVRRYWRRARREAGWLSVEDPGVRDRLVDDMESRPLAVEALIRRESVEQVLAALAALSPSDQDLLFSFYFDGLSQADLAREAGVTEKSVECRLYRARGRLRAMLRHPERSGVR